MRLALAILALAGGLSPNVIIGAAADAPPALPWVRNAVWPYSNTGRRQPPETLLASAALEEVNGAPRRAYHLYQRVWDAYGDACLPGAFAQAYLGMARCLSALGRPREAAGLLLKHSDNGGVLCNRPAARGLLEALASRPEIREDARILQEVRERLAGWPRGPGDKEDKRTKRQGDWERRSLHDQTFSPEKKGAGVKYAEAEGEAGRALTTARFYMRRGERRSAVVYLRYVISRYPESQEARTAAALLATQEQGDKGTG